jgi:predicted metal-dependent phosphoesterase TrpH
MIGGKTIQTYEHRRPRPMQHETVHADLHAHTCYSDGTLPPAVLVERAAERGVQVLAITDHDTTDGLEDARETDQEWEIRLVPGVELSVEAKDRPVHVLGYGFDPTHPAIEDYLSALTQQRQARFNRMVQCLSDSGVQIASHVVDRHVEQSSAPGRPHLARVLIDEGHVDSYQAAFDEYLGRDRPAYVPAPACPAGEAIEALHAAGGVAVVAHPGQWMPGSVLRFLRDQGLDGIECMVPSHPDYLVDYYQNICRSHSLLITGGSDYHGNPDAEETDLGTVGLTPAQWERFRAAIA